MRRRSVLVALLALPAMFVGWQEAAIAYFGSAAPDRAPTALLADATLRLSAVEAKSAGRGFTSLPPDPDQMQLARLALEEAPLNPVAVRHLGGAFDPAAQIYPVTETLELSSRISRRDRRTQLALFLVQGRAGREERAIVHLDRLLTVRPGLGRELAVPLTALASSPPGRQLLGSYRARPWFGLFVREAISQDVSHVDLAQMLLQLPELPAGLTDEDVVPLVEKLLMGGERDLANRMLELAGIDPRVLEQFAPTAETVDPKLGLVGWTPVRDATARAEFVDGQLHFSGSGGRIKTATSRVMALAPGHFELVTMLVRGSEDLSYNWRLECLADEAWRERWSGRWQLAGETAVGLEGEIPQDCIIQKWSLQVQTPESQMPIEAFLGFRLVRGDGD